MSNTAPKVNNFISSETQTKEKCGWFRLWRKQFSTELYDVPLRGYLWIRLLNEANWGYSEEGYRFKGDKIFLKPGELAFCFSSFAKNIKMQERSARRYLRWLRKNGYVAVESSGKRTKITICNWDVYQDSELRKKTEKRTEVSYKKSTKKASKEHEESIKEATHSKENKELRTKNKERKKEEQSVLKYTLPPDFPAEVKNPHQPDFFSPKEADTPPILSHIQDHKTAPQAELTHSELIPDQDNIPQIVKSKKKSKTPTPEDYKLAQKWLNYSYELNPTAKFNLKTFADEIRITRESIKFNAIEMDTLYLWITRDEFWSKVVISPCGLRKKSKNNGLRKIDNILTRFRVDANKYISKKSSVENFIKRVQAEERAKNGSN